MKRIVLVICALLMLLNGCSYKNFEDNLMGYTSDEDSLYVDSKTSNIPSEVSSDNIPEDEITFQEIERNDKTFPWADQIEYKGFDETFSAFFDLHEFEPDGYGREGLSYKLINVEVFPSLDNSPISSDECLMDEQMINEIENSSFVLVYLEAYYEDGTQDENDIFLDFNLAYKTMDKPDIPFPRIIYNSQHLLENGAEGIHHYFVMPSMRNGEVREIQIGFIANSYYIETQSICLSVGPYRPITDTMICRYFTLF